MKYSYKKKVALPFGEAVEKTKQALAKEGFGVLNETDVKKTIKTKLGVDYPDYVILGVCNPEFSYKALEAEKEIGLFLPCKIIIYEKDGDVIISAMLPGALLKIVENEKMESIFFEVEKKIKNAIDAI